MSNVIPIEKIVEKMGQTLKTTEGILEGILKDEVIKDKVVELLNIKVESLNTTQSTLDIVSLLEKNEDYKKQVIEYVRDLYRDQFEKIDKAIVKHNKEIQEKEAENKKITDEIEVIKNQYGQLIEKNDNLKDENFKLEIEFKELEGKNKTRREKRNELDKEIEDKLKEYQNIKNSILELEIQKNQLNNELKNIKPMYEELKNKAIKEYQNILSLEKETLGKEKSYLEENIKNLKEKKDNLENTIINIENRNKELEKKEAEIESLKQDLNFEKEKIQLENERIIFLKQKIKDYETDIILSLNENHQREIKHLNELLKIEQDKSQLLEIRNRKLEILCENTPEKEELDQQIKELLEEKRILEDKLFGKTEERERKIRDLEAEKRILEEQNEEILKQNVKLTEEKLTLRKYEIEFETKMAKIDDFNKSKEELFLLLEKKDKQISELKGRGMSEEAKKQVIEQSYFEEKDLIQRPNFVNEMIWLGEIMDKVKNVGFVFSSRLLYAFHTSLKISDWSSLSILAGVSGTGKSELPKLYSRYGGLNFISLAVQPNWDSPHSLFGYYNSLEGKFNATSLLKILYQAQAGVENSINDYLTIVLLDEMNLAHVELYFSELLSKLESLRGKEDGEILEIDIAENKPYEIVLNNSIMWVGTMNEDETTKSLSDKVIDRGNLISFPKPNKLITRASLKELEPALKLRKENWDSWKWTENKVEKLEKKLEDLKAVVEDINKALEGSGRAIGHRVWQSIENYIKNYPLVLANLENEDDNDLNRYLQVAFEDALVQKLIPKLRGLETSGDIRTKCLDKIKEIVEQKANGILTDFEIALNNPYGVFVWTSSTYLEKDI